MARRVLFDFNCAQGCGIFFEELVFWFEKESKCPNCGKQAEKILSAPHIGYRIMGADTSFPTAAAKWEKMQWQKARTDKGGLADGQPNLKEY